MCKHVAAVLYGIGARLDEQPELLFRLRKVDEKDLIAKAGQGLPLSEEGPAADRVLAAEGLSELFGLEIDGSAETPMAEAAPAPAPKEATSARRAAKPRTKPAAVAAPAKTATRRSSTSTTKKPPKAKASRARTKPRRTPRRRP